MLNLGRIKIPPIKNVLDVAMQTVRQQVPEKPGQPPRPPQNVRFANMGKCFLIFFPFFYFFKNKKNHIHKYVSLL